MNKAEMKRADREGELRDHDDSVEEFLFGGCEKVSKKEEKGEEEHGHSQEVLHRLEKLEKVELEAHVETGEDENDAEENRVLEFSLSEGVGAR